MNAEAELISWVNAICDVLEIPYNSGLDKIYEKIKQQNDALNIAADDYFFGADHGFKSAKEVKELWLKEAKK